jgi:hypothetical protein
LKQFKFHCDGGVRPTIPGNGYGSYEIESMCHIVGDRFYKRGHYEMEFGSGMIPLEAEYAALMVGLNTLLHDSTKGWLSEYVLPDGITLCCYSDSMSMVSQLTGKTRKIKGIDAGTHSAARALLERFGHWNLKWNSRRLNVARFGH